jgi:hypothetical protein
MVILTVTALNSVAPANASMLLSGIGDGYLGQGGGYLGYASTVIYRFQTSVTLRVTALGIADVDSTGVGNGLFESHNVALWDDSSNLLGEVTVSAGTVDPLINGFRFANLASAVTIGPGTYWLATEYATLWSDNPNADLISVNSEAQWDAIMADWATPDGYGAGSYSPFPPEIGLNPGGPAGPNMLASPVPEPGSLVIFGAIAILGLCWGGRWRISKGGKRVDTKPLLS